MAPLTALRQAAAVAAVLLAGATAQAQTFDLDLTADGDSRFFDFFSAVFSQLDQSGNTVPSDDDFDPADDGFFLVTEEPGQQFQTVILSPFSNTQMNVGNEATFDAFTPTAFTGIGGGVDTFPSEGDFSGIGSLEFDAGTGAITGLSLDVFPFVVDTNSPLIQNPLISEYTTVVTAVTSGSVEITPSGGVASIENLVADIAFVYGGVFAYDGTFEIDGDRFDLFVDRALDVPNPNFGFPGQPEFVEIRLAWDVEGGVNNLVPEPSAGLSVLMASLAAAGWRRRLG